MSRHIASWIAAAATALAVFSVRAQSVPEQGSNAAISSVQATACVPPNPPNNRVDHCGWGVWALDTQRQTLIAALAAPASYLICREQVDAAEPRGYPIQIEVDGVVLAAGTPATPLGQSPTGCFLVSGKKIAIAGTAKPNKPVRGYYIRLGQRTFANTIRWVLQRGGAVSGERGLIAQGAQPRAYRVCFGDYQPVAGAPRPLGEYKLWLDTALTTVRGTEVAVFAFASCVDVDAKLLAAEPVWSASEPAVGYGNLSF